MAQGPDRRAVPTAVAHRSARHGQMIVVFALALTAMLAMAGLLVDGGMAWVNRRQAQAAADAATLAAAVAISKGGTMTEVKAAARATALANGFPANFKDCSGVSHSDGSPPSGVEVFWPPTGASIFDQQVSIHAGDLGYVEVIATRAMPTAFAGVVGQSCWLVTARAVATVRSHVAECSLCSLSQGPIIHKVLLDNGTDLRTDGAIVINGRNTYGGCAALCGSPPQCSTDPCTPATCNPPYTWNYVRVCGDVIELHQTGGASSTHVSAQSIAITGGWETRGGTVMEADGYAGGSLGGVECPFAPEPPAYTTPPPNGPPTPHVARVCIGAPPIADPLNDPAAPPLDRIPAPNLAETFVPQAGQRGCNALPGTTLMTPTGVTMVIPSVTKSFTICPGLYYGGIHESGDFGVPTVYMLPGIYYMFGGGFWVTGSANITSVLPGGLDLGVMIYNSGGPVTFSSSDEPPNELVPPCDPLTSKCKDTIIGGSGPLGPNGLSSSDNPTSVGLGVTYTMRLKNQFGPITGNVAFYDGSTLIIGCESKPLATEDATHASATCLTSYGAFGSRAITAVYLGDATYAPQDDTLTEKINPPPTSPGFGLIRLETQTPTPGPGHVTLHAPRLGRYSGLLLFQDRDNPNDINIFLGASTAPDCTGSWMTDGVPPNGNPIPAPCGPLGGLSGTVYSAHECGINPCGAGDSESTVDLRTTGLANLQIIAAKIYMNFGNDIRLAFDPSFFANGELHLVE